MFLKSIVDVNVVDTILENLIRQKNYYVYIKKKGKYINLFYDSKYTPIYKGKIQKMLNYNNIDKILLNPFWEMI